VLKWLFPDSAAVDKDISTEMRMATLEARILDLELEHRFASVSSTKGPPGMSNLRPGYSRRSSNIAKAQEILNEKLRKDVPSAA